MCDIPLNVIIIIIIIIIIYHDFLPTPRRGSHVNNKIIYHDFLPTPRRGSHVKSDKTQKKVIKIHPLAHILGS